MKCVTEVAALKLQSNALKRNDIPQLLAYVTGVDWKTIVAFELHYHNSCYSNYTRKDRKGAGDLKNSTTNILYHYVQSRVIEKFEVVSTNDIIDFHEKCADGNATLCKRTITDLIKTHFRDSISFWTPNHESTFIFNEQTQKGQIIEVLMKKIRKLHY